MNKELVKAFTNDKFGNIRVVLIGGREEFEIDGTVVTRFDILAEASRAKTKEESWGIMEFASKAFHPTDDSTFNTLYGDVAMEITRRFQKTELQLMR